MIILVGFIIFFFTMEARQIKKLKLQYFLSVWNILDMSSLCFNMALVIMDWAGRPIENLRPVSAFAILLMWWKFFYYLRLFDSTAALVRMLLQIGSDMTTFTFVLFIAICAFTNSFFILHNNRFCDGEGEKNRNDGTTCDN